MKNWTLLQLDGMIIAPTDAKRWGSGLLWWIEFSKLQGISIQGSGTIEGQGSVWWTTMESDVDPVSHINIYLHHKYMNRSAHCSQFLEFLSAYQGRKTNPGSFSVKVIPVTLRNKYHLTIYIQQKLLTFILQTHIPF